MPVAPVPIVIDVPNSAVTGPPSPVVPSCVNVASLPAPNERTEESDSNFKSSPIIASLATLNPPSVCNEPSVVDVASVVSSVLIIPLAVMVVVVVAPATSTAPEKSPVAASISPVIVKFLIPV